MLFFPYNKKGKQKDTGSPRDGMVSLKERRAPHAACGSLTLEAALVMPLFIAAIVALMFFIQVIQIQIHIQKALYNQTLKVAGYAFYTKLADLSDTAENMLSAEYIKYQVINEAGKEYLDNSYIAGGSGGIHANLTGDVSDGILDVALEYSVSPPFNLLGMGKIVLVSRARCHTWIGNTETDTDGEKEDTEDVVYMAPTGEVYHLYRDCTYLTNQISRINAGEIEGVRNESGAKYYPCSVCCRDGLPAAGDEVYYTPYGTRYHKDFLCNNLYCNIYMMDKKTAQEQYRICSKCAKRSGENGG